MTTTTQKKAPAGGAAGGGHARDDKRFATLAAQFALCGHALVKARPDDTQAPFYVMRWGWIRPLGSLNAAERFLREIEGARDGAH